MILNDLKKIIEAHLVEPSSVCPDFEKHLKRARTVCDAHEFIVICLEEFI